MWNHQYNPRGEWQQSYGEPQHPEPEPTWAQVYDFGGRIHQFAESSRRSGVPQNDIADWLRPLDMHIMAAIAHERDALRLTKMRVIQSRVRAEMIH